MQILAFEVQLRLKCSRFRLKRLVSRPKRAPPEQTPITIKAKRESHVSHVTPSILDHRRARDSILNAMKNEQLLSDITDYCRREGMAESTFGRRAVNDGKLVPRLREGRRITVETLDRIRKVLGEPTRRSSVEAALPLPPEPPLERRD